MTPRKTNGDKTNDDSGIEYCLAQIRRYDRDRTLTVLAAPRAAAADLAVLYAFNLEITLVRDSVTEPMLGRIRLQWWREALAEVYAGRPRRHAVLESLAALHARAPLSRQHFERLIDARETEFDEVIPADLAALESYADATSGDLLRLAAEAAGIDPVSGDAATLIRHVGIGFSLTGIARATLYLARRRHTLLPQSLLAKHGVSLDRLYELKPQPGLNAAIAELAAAARGHLDAARRLPAPSPLLPALRIGTLARAHLARLRHRDHDLFDPRSIEASPRDIWRIAGKRLIGSW
ncbi:squalene/phytoene synthase family protein [Dongia sp.]|uniref:squalene/phytoene synthase family protein n=1 Tax=Dongia sp. TaxID=1977262 RepID=UPI00374FF497